MFVDANGLLEEFKIKKISTKRIPFSFYIFEENTLPISELDDIRIFQNWLKFLCFPAKGNCIYEVSPIIEPNHDPANLSFIARGKIANSIYEDIPFLVDHLYHILKLYLIIDDGQLWQVGIWCDPIAIHDEMLVVLCIIVAIIIDSAHLLLWWDAGKDGIIVVDAVMRFYWHENLTNN